MPRDDIFPDLNGLDDYAPQRYLDDDEPLELPAQRANKDEEEPEIKLSDEQTRCYDAIKSWLRDPSNAPGDKLRMPEANPKMMVVTGFAGSGKTTLLKYVHRHVVADVPEVKLMAPMFCAFTGKAASVLRRKGVASAMTIHSTIYAYDRINHRFDIKSKVHGGLFVVDEASTVSKRLFDDLATFNLPMLFVGDPGQLEPIGDDIRITEKSNFHLNEIHRQAKESPIISFSMVIRNRQDFTTGEFPGLKIIPNTGIDLKLLGAFVGADSQIICGLNATRTQVNASVRSSVLGFPEDEPLVAGDKVICLRNDRDSGLSNGETGIVLDARPGAVGIRCDIQFDGYETPHKNMFVHRPTLGDGKVHNDYDHWSRSRRNLGERPVALTYGYAITAHKAQGSEWARVLVIDEGGSGKWDESRWRYVAATRAKQELVFATNCRWKR